MKRIFTSGIVFLMILALTGPLQQCKKGGPEKEPPLKSYEEAMQTPSGKPVAVMFTTYSTTLIADGKEQTRLRIAVTDSVGREITGAEDSVRIYVDGAATILSADGGALGTLMDSTGVAYYPCRLDEGICRLLLQARDLASTTGVEARSGKLWPGSHEIHFIPADFENMSPRPEQLPPGGKSIDRMIGADISFLPQLEDHGMKFYDKGEETDAIEMLRDHGFNYIRLRIFVNPGNEQGYAPGKGYCGLGNTLAMARRIKKAGLKLLLDFHYSDYWADPQQQYKPLAWEGLPFDILQDSVREYTSRVLRAFESQGTLPDMVQIGNEINHGILWPDGHISNPDQLAALLRAGVEGCDSVSPDLPVMMHIALGGQNDEAVFWLDNMIARDVHFDVIGISYYPRWHGTLDDLNYNLHDLVKRYGLPVNVVEYSQFIPEVHEIVFSLPDNMGTGTCIWEPLGRRGPLVDQSGNTTEKLLVYDRMHEQYLE